MCRLDLETYSLLPTVSADLLVPSRPRSRPMKAVTTRKATAQNRIDLNRFWNEMEEFYDR